MEFTRSYSGAPWETEVGYCRAIRAGNLIFVTGTAAGVCRGPRTC